MTAFHGLPGLAALDLAKPFGMDTLVRRVRTILDERHGQGRAQPTAAEPRIESRGGS